MRTLVPSGIWGDKRRLQTTRQEVHFSLNRCLFYAFPWYRFMSRSQNKSSIVGANYTDEEKLPPPVMASKGTRDMMELFAELAQVLGVPKSLAAIYGLLYATPRALSFREICQGAGLSKGSVSQGLRFLRSVGVIKRIGDPEARCDYYEPVMELKQLAGAFFREKLNPLIEGWKSRNAGLDIRSFGETISEEEKFLLKERIRKLERWQKQAALVLPMLGKLLGH